MFENMIDRDVPEGYAKSKLNCCVYRLDMHGQPIYTTIKNTPLKVTVSSFGKSPRANTG